MNFELDDEQQKAVDRIEKLLRLAAKNTSEEEAKSATAKAQELLVAYNLNMSIIEQASGGKSKRADEKMSGGLYKYQRALWEAVAKLNFCMYWNQYTWDSEKKNRRTGKLGGYRFEHRVVGRQVNVVTTRTMAEYLEQAIERLTRERLDGDGTQFFTQWAISFREGIAERITERILERRREILAEEKRQQFEAQKKATEAGMAGQSTATSLTVATMTQQETEANYDFLHGEGAWARRKAREAQWEKQRAEERAKRAEADRRAEEEYTKWAEAHPEEAAAEEKKRLAAERRRQRQRERYQPRYRPRADTPEEQRRWSGGFKAGYAAGEGVSLEPQMDSGTNRRIGR